MDMQQELAELRAELARTAPPGRAALYEAKIDELRASGVLDSALRVGDEAPDFALPAADGREISLTGLLAEGPAVLTFYRGGWCPYCNIQLRAYQRILPEVEALGGRLLAISPQLPDGSLSTLEQNALRFGVASDVGNVVARSFGLVFSLAPELREVMRANGKALSAINGDESWELPVPATYVVAPDRRIALAFVEADHRTRLAPEEIIGVLRGLRAAKAAAA
jgi:peroxiredoxin